MRIDIRKMGLQEYVVWNNGDVSTRLKNVHLPEKCEDRPCVIHRPTNHHMREWLLHWRNDRGIFERFCEHGIGHPDPDQFAYWKENGLDHEKVHGCDGCCEEGDF